MVLDGSMEGLPNDSSTARAAGSNRWGADAFV